MGSSNAANTDTLLSVSFTSGNVLNFSYYGDDATSPAYPSDINNWTHWVLIFDNTHLTKYIYHNGTLVTTQTNSGILNAANGIYIGSSLGNSSYFNGISI
jgi:hypothetical protein